MFKNYYLVRKTLKLHCCFSNTKEIYSQLTSRKITKFRENREIVENVFFPEYQVISQKQKISKLLQEKGFTEKEALITEEEYNKCIENSDIINRQKDQTKFYKKTKEEILQMIEKNNLNENLLKIVLKFSWMLGRMEVQLFLSKLEWTFVNEEKIKKEELEKFNRKREKLQKIHPNVDMKFNSVFLRKQNVFQHKGWLHLIQNNEKKISLGYYTIMDSILVAKNFIWFSGKEFPLSLYHALKKRVEPELEKMKSSELANYAEFLKIVSEKEIIQDNFDEMLFKINSILLKQDFSTFSSKTLLKIIVTLGKISRAPNELCYRLEPYFLKFLNEFDMNSLSTILKSFLILKQGSDDFKQIISTIISNKSDQLNYQNGIALFAVLNNFKFQTKNHHLIFGHLQKNLLDSLIKKIVKETTPTTKEIIIILQGMGALKIYNVHYSELLSASFIKTLEINNEQQFRQFVNCLFELTNSNLHSPYLMEFTSNRAKPFLKNLPQNLEISGLLSEDKNFEPNIVTNMGPNIEKEKINVARYENILLKSFTFDLKYLWSYLKQAWMLKKFNSMDFEIINLFLKRINSNVSKLQKFPGILHMQTYYFEMLHQIKLLLNFHKHNLITQKFEIENLIGLKFQAAKENNHMSVTDHLFRLEKKLFLKQFESSISRNQIYNDYLFPFVLKNEKEKNQTFLFFNDSKLFAKDASNKFHENGVLTMRKEVLINNNIPFVELNFSEVIQKSLQMKNESLGAVKELLKEYIPQSDEMEKQKECDFFLEKIMEMRKNLDANSHLENYKPKDQNLQTQVTEELKDQDKNSIEEENEIETSDSEDYEKVFKEYKK